MGQLLPAAFLRTAYLGKATQLLLHLMLDALLAEGVSTFREGKQDGVAVANGALLGF